jgi:F-box domain
MCSNTGYEYDKASSVKEGFPLLQLPTVLLPEILGYLSLGEVVLLRRVCCAFKDATLSCISQKLQKAGSEGVLQQNLQVGKLLELYFCQTKKINTQNPFDYHFVKTFILTNPGTERMDLTKSLFEVPNLGGRFAKRNVALDGGVLTMGILIPRKLLLRVRVPVQQYRQELIFQRDSLPRNVFESQVYERILRSVEKRIETMKFMTRGFMYVRYLPKLENHPFDMTSYDKFVIQTKEPSWSKTLLLRGIGHETTTRVAVCPKFPELVFVVRKGDVDGMFATGFQKIDENIARIKSL